MNRKQYVHENVVHNFMKDEDGNVINTIQNYADFAAMGLDFIPVVGTVAGSAIDAGSALVDVAQGEYGDAAIRGIQAIPGVGAAQAKHPKPLHPQQDLFRVSLVVVKIVVKKVSIRLLLRLQVIVKNS